MTETKWPHTRAGWRRMKRNIMDLRILRREERVMKLIEEIMRMREKLDRMPK